MGKGRAESWGGGPQNVGGGRREGVASTHLITLGRSPEGAVGHPGLERTHSPGGLHADEKLATLPNPRPFAVLNGLSHPGHAQDSRARGSQLDGQGGQCSGVDQERRRERGDTVPTPTCRMSNTQ